MNKSNKMNVKLKIGLKSFITVIAILLLVLITVGVLTYVIPAGRYTIYTTDESKIGQPFYQYTTDESLNKQIVFLVSAESLLKFFAHGDHIDLFHKISTSRVC